jgi:hypothetical protein
MTNERHNNTKTCTKCHEVKPLDEFSAQRRTKDGKQPRCKACFAEYRHANREAIAKQRAGYRERPEVKARNAKYKAEYYQAHRDDIRAYKAEYYQANRNSILAKQTEYYADNRDTVRAYQAEYLATNPHVGWEAGYRERAKHYGFEPVVERFTKDDVIAKYGDSCWHCDGAFEELDHAPIPVAHGGHHTLVGVKPSCVKCNRKGTSVRRLNQTDIGETA